MDYMVTKHLFSNELLEYMLYSADDKV